MTLSLLEMRERAKIFIETHKNDSNENSEAKTYWIDFFHVFGVDRRDVFTFERKVQNLDDSYGFIDLFWSGKLVVEHNL